MEFDRHRAGVADKVGPQRGGVDHCRAVGRGAYRGHGVLRCLCRGGFFGRKIVPEKFATAQQGDGHHHQKAGHQTKELHPFSSIHWV